MKKAFVQHVNRVPFYGLSVTMHRYHPAVREDPPGDLTAATSPTASRSQADYRPRNVLFEGLLTRFDVLRRSAVARDVRRPDAGHAQRAQRPRRDRGGRRGRDPPRRHPRRHRRVPRRAAALHHRARQPMDGPVARRQERRGHDRRRLRAPPRGDRGHPRRRARQIRPARGRGVPAPPPSTRTGKLLFEEFTRAFNKADMVVVTEVYAARRKPAIEGATGEVARRGDPGARAPRRDLRPRQAPGRPRPLRHRRAGATS